MRSLLMVGSLCAVLMIFSGCATVGNSGGVLGGGGLLNSGGGVLGGGGLLNRGRGGGCLGGGGLLNRGGGGGCLGGGLRSGGSCLLYTSPSPRDATLSRMPSSA